MFAIQLTMVSITTVKFLFACVGSAMIDGCACNCVSDNDAQLYLNLNELFKARKGF